MKIKSIQDRWLLSDGNEIPVLGFGLYLVEPGSQSQQSIMWALEAGYRHFDTAAFYDNESDLGTLIKKSGISRDELFITTKLWNDDHGYHQTLKAFDSSLQKLGTDYVDLYLIHWPVVHKRSESWQALIELKKQGKARKSKEKQGKARKSKIDRCE